MIEAHFMQTGPIYCALAGIDLHVPFYDLGDGIFLRKTNAHLMAPFLMSFKPINDQGYHPAPWVASTGGYTFDIKTELFIPANSSSKKFPACDIANIIAFLLFLNVNPSTTLVAISNHPFSLSADEKIINRTIIPYQTSNHCFLLSGKEEINDNIINWVRDNWKTALQLFHTSSEFSLAVNSLMNSQFFESSAMSLVSLWAAIEALFSPSKSELKFRISALVSTFLEERGDERYILQKRVAKLYDKRSSAAHGLPKQSADDLLMTINLLRDILFKILEDKIVPDKKNLERLLFS